MKQLSRGICVFAVLAGGLGLAEGATVSTMRQIVAADGIDLSHHLTPRNAGYDGVAGLILNTTQGSFLCTGSLLAGGKAILTAAHCVTDGLGNPILNYADAVFFPPGTTGNEVHRSWKAVVHPLWDGDLGAGNDLALLLLNTTPSAGVQRYDLYSEMDEVGMAYQVVGFGARGSDGLGYVSGTSGRRRTGFNVFTASSTSTFDLIGFTAGENILLSDFDNGLPENDGFGFFFGLSGLGVGAMFEASTAPGDSGGPSFIEGKIAAVTSFGATLAFSDGTTSDIDDQLNASFGEFNGFTRVSKYTEWIEYNSTVPEPSAYLLMASGLGALLFFRRRR
ncbi:MAG: trypsin-like serine protease [Acidobacteria bacterium]|nr:trypsin-like serine protease [Acidobacteriota bacterium]